VQGTTIRRWRSDRSRYWLLAIAGFSWDLYAIRNYVRHDLRATAYIAYYRRSCTACDTAIITRSELICLERGIHPFRCFTRRMLSPSWIRPRMCMCKPGLCTYAEEEDHITLELQIYRPDSPKWG
jgi:hypothetical protein